MGQKRQELVEVRDARRGGWFWDFHDVFDRSMPAHAKIVRLYLARCANDQQLAWPSLETIAEKCGLSRATVVRALKWLVDSGWVKRLPRSGGYNNLGSVYVLLNPPQEAVPDGAGQSAHTESIQGESILCDSVQGDPIHSDSIQADPILSESALREPVQRESNQDDTAIGSVGAAEKYPRTRQEYKPNGASARVAAAGQSVLPPGPPSAPGNPKTATNRKTGSLIEEPPDDRALIAELTARLHELPGVKRLRGHYSLIGRAYKEYGYQVVSEALEDMELVLLGNQAMGLPEPSEQELAKLLFGKCRWNRRLGGSAEDRPVPSTPGTDDIEAWCKQHGYVRVPGTNRLVRVSPKGQDGGEGRAD